MPRFIELNNAIDNNHVYINVANIVYVETSSDCSVVYICGGTDGPKPVYVKETYGTIISILNE